MQGIITSEKESYVKAAIVKLTRIRVLSEDKESDVEGPEKIETESVTYAEADEEGRYLIEDINPKDKYIIEILVKKPEVKPVKEGKNEGIKKSAGKRKSQKPAVQAMDSPTVVEDSTNDPDDPEDPDFEDEDEITDKNFIIGSLKTNSELNYTISENLSVKNLNETFSPYEKSYMKKCNLW